MIPPDDGQARLEFIETELRFVRNCVTSAGLYLKHHDIARAKELLDAANRSHNTVEHQLLELPPELDLRILQGFADLLADDMRELQKEIQRSLRE